MAGKDLAFNIIAFDKASATFNKVGRSVEANQPKMSKWGNAAKVASVVAGGALLKLGKDAIGTSRRMTDLDTKARAVFENQLATVGKWADANKRAFGLSRRETVGLAASFADLLKPMGFTAEQAAGMSTDVVGLSGALSKWSAGQFTAAEVSEKLSKAMLGEREELKSLGISISEADVQARLAEKGQKDLTGAALAQAKAIATQELIMEKSTDAQKAWAEGGREAAEAENATKTATKELSESFARFLTPAIKTGTQVLSKLAGWVERNRALVGPAAVAVAGLAASVWAVNAATKAYVATSAAWSAITTKLIPKVIALNVALFANPIGLVILAVAGLTAAFVVAYTKSETFRGFVQALWDKLQAAFGWVKRNWPLLLAILTGPFGLAVLAIAKNWDRIKRGAQGVVDWFKGLPGKITRAVSGAFGGLWTAFKGAVNNIIRAWNRLKFTIGGGSYDPLGRFGPAVTVPAFTFRTPEIPTLAEGGITTRDTLAMLHKDEAVIPLDRRGIGDTYNFHFHGAVADRDQVTRWVQDGLLTAQRRGVKLGFIS